MSGLTEKKNQIQYFASSQANFQAYFTTELTQHSD